MSISTNKLWLLAACVVCFGTPLMSGEITKGYTMIEPDDTMEKIVHKAANVTPSARQIEWQRLEFYAFVHFGVNTFTDREWGDGKEHPDIFKPSKFNPRQWVKACKAAGMKMIILTTKHHDGFCLWPSKYTEHSVKNSEWRNGRGDVVKAVSDACRQGGLKFGVYLSPWDRHDPRYGDSPAYNKYFKHQLRELLTNYGDIACVWFDGAGGGGQVYDWQGYYSVIRELQPEATIHIRGPDVRWCGNEAGHTRKSEWSVIPIPTRPDKFDWTDMRAQDLGSRDKLKGAKCLVWYPAEVNTSIRPGWFYHPGQNNRVKPLDKLLDIYYGSVGGNATFLLNLPPTREGLIHKNDAKRLRELGAVLKATFDENLAHGAVASADQIRGDAPDFAPDKAIDGDSKTFWATDDGITSANIQFDLGEATTFNRAMLGEHIANGQRIEKFAVDAWLDNRWREIATATTVGYKRLLRFDNVTTNKVRVRIIESRVCPELARFGLFFAPPKVSRPVITRDRQGIVTIESQPGVEVRYWLDTLHPAEPSRRYEKPFPLPQGGTIKAVAIPQDDSDLVVLNDSLFSEAVFGPAKSDWKVVHVDSEEAPREAAVNAIDGDPDSIWHTEWKTKKPDHPHEIQVDLSEEMELTGFTYLPRNDASKGGSIVSKYKLYLSRDGKSWGQPVAAGTFDNMANNPVLQELHFEKPVTARYFRFVTLDEVTGRHYASAAELGVLVDPPQKSRPEIKPTGWKTFDLNMPEQAVERRTDVLPLSDQANKGDWVKYAPMWDEFDGAELDTNTWFATNPRWKGRKPAFFNPDNVSVSDGKLHLVMRRQAPPASLKPKGYHTYSSAAVRSHGTVRYGYFEVKVKPMASAGSSSFWLYQSTRPWWTEIDVFETGGKAKGFERRLNMNVHVHRTPAEDRHWSKHGHWVAPFDLADDYHVYGLEWDEEDIKFYFDGRLVRSGPNTHWHQPQWVNFDSETMPDWFGLPKKEDLPSTYSIEYIRVWKRADERP